MGELWDRLSEALGCHDVAPPERDTIIQAYGAEPDSTAKWPQEAKALLAEIEARPATCWDDPADVPDDLESHPV
jgi:hypothetical protein